MKEGKAARAAALRYNPETMGAPQVVAAGKGYVAERIIETAAAGGVPVRSEPALAEALQTVELGREIPSALYQAVAEVLAFVWFLDSKRADAGGSGQGQINPEEAGK